MGWDQNYSFPTVQDLLEDLTGKTALELLKKELKRTKKITVAKVEGVVIDGFCGAKVPQVRLSNGKVFEPALVEKYTSNGNYGLDTYKFIDRCMPKPKVKHRTGWGKGA
jgi:hypothetical protein